MILSKIEKGKLGGIYSFVRFGKGSENLIILPPLNDALFDSEAVAGYLYFLFHPLGRDYNVTVISRRRNMPVGYTTRDMAVDYAALLKTSIGPSHILGVSLGGMIAQYLAIDCPQYVKKLILIASAHCMGHEGLLIARRWIPWARAGKWEEIYDETIGLTYNGFYGRAYSALKPLCRKWLMKKMAKDSSDFIISGQAGMLHDSFDELSAISAPTLVMAGTRDRFFPESLFWGMTRKIPGCREVFVPQAGHGVYEEHRKLCLQAILDFMSGKLDFEMGPAKAWKPSIIKA